MSTRKGISRRRFIRTAGAVTAGVVGFPYIVRSSALGKAGAVAPSNRITMGCIGVGWQGGENLQSFLSLDDVQVLALCDIDKNHLKEALESVSEQYGNTDCATYHNFEELIARDDIDTVSLGLPDHWHAIPAIAAAKAGKDMFGEKTSVPQPHRRQGHVRSGEKVRYHLADRQLAEVPEPFSPRLRDSSQRTNRKASYGGSRSSFGA